MSAKRNRYTYIGFHKWISVHLYFIALELNCCVNVFHMKRLKRHIIFIYGYAGCRKAAFVPFAVKIFFDEFINCVMMDWDY